MVDRYLCNFLQFGDAEFSKKFCIFFQKGLAKNISDEEETEEVTVDDKDKSILTVSQEANTPDTGDDSNFSMWILLLAIMGVFLGGFARKNNLCKKHENRRG